MAQTFETKITLDASDYISNLKKAQKTAEDFEKADKRIGSGKSGKGGGSSLFGDLGKGGGIGSGLKSAFSDIASIGEKAASGLGSAFSKLSGIGDKAVGGLGSKITGMAGKAKEAGGTMSTLFSGALLGAGAKVASMAIDGITSAIKDFQSELSESSAAWQTFTANMEMNGHTAEEIAGVKNELSDFAQKTIYSSSDMATTFSQLDAVGVKSADQLVTAMGGLAASAANPSQAMKSLSEQITQAAAKPTLTWQDFRIMLEQSPAGMAAVAKQMGMSTSELVSDVQSGTVQTQAFLDALTAAGNSDSFQKLATQYKTIGQAVDGLKETITNGLQGSFDGLQSAGIRVIGGLTSLFERLEPAINTVLDTISDLTNGLADLMEKFGLSGAAKQEAGYTDDMAASAKEATKQIKNEKDAQDSLKRSVMSFDQLHKLSDNSGNSTAAKTDTGTSSLPAASVDTKNGTSAIDALKSKLQGLQPVIATAKNYWDAFKRGVNEGIGGNGLSSQMSVIREGVSNIGSALKDIATDPEVMNSANKFGEKASEAIGSVIGTTARVGLDVGANLIGGLGTYLQQNTDRIKDYLIDMFDIGGDVADLVRETCGSIGQIADTLLTPQAQQTTANILGIFTDFAMGVSRQIAQIGDDLLHLLLDPINNNIDAITANLDAFFGDLQVITGGIKECLDGIIDHGQEIYNEHIHPMFQTITDGITEIVGRFNETIAAFQPAIDKTAQMISDMWTQHIEPACEKIGDFAGSIADLFSAVWTKFLKPIADVLADVLVPVILAISRIVVGVVDWLADKIGKIFGALKSGADWLTSKINGSKGLQGWADDVHESLTGKRPSDKTEEYDKKDEKTTESAGSLSKQMDELTKTSGSWSNKMDSIEQTAATASALPKSKTVSAYTPYTQTSGATQTAPVSLSGVSDAVAQGTAKAMATALSGNAGDIVLKIDSEDIARANIKGAKKLNIRRNPVVAYN